ncbi:MAG: Arsenical pump-driving ATPase, partial [uncultured Solirubrobacteraceae bacterium]
AGLRAGPRRRHGQGRRRQVDRGRGARARGRAARPADDRGRGGRPRRRLPGARGLGDAAVRGARRGRPPLPHLHRPRAGDGGVPRRPAPRARAGRRADLLAPVHLPRRGDAGHARAPDDGEGLGAGPGPAADPGRAPLRPRGPRRARHGPWRRGARRAEHVRGSRARRS